MSPPALRTLVLYMLLGLLAACGEDAPPPAPPPSVLITVTQVERAPLEILERSVGRIESRAHPLVAAEVAGQVRSVTVEVGHAVREGDVLAVIEPEDYRLRLASAQAEIGRLEAQVEQQQRLVSRYRELASSDFFAQNSLEEAEAQLKVLTRQLEAQRAGADQTRRDLARTQIKAPVAGRVEHRLVDPGDYVQEGSGMFRLSTDAALRAVLPYPERLVGTLRTGQAVRLQSPTAPGQVVEAVVTELRPTVGTANRALEVLVDFDNPGGWRSGASTDGAVVVERREGALTVPEASVILRPAGPTVYVVEGDKVVARVVRTGARRDGRVEILEGLAEGATIALDGAGFLTDGAAVRLHEARP